MEVTKNLGIATINWRASEASETLWGVQIRAGAVYVDINIL